VKQYEEEWASGIRKKNRGANLYPIENPKPKFLPYDLCWIAGTKELVLVTEVNLNKCQTTDVYQWSFSVKPLTPGNTKCAWFDMDELEFIANIFDVIAESSVHPFSSTAFEFSVSSSERRRK